jgi:thymidylate synthase
LNILVFQQNGSGETKVAGIKAHGGNDFQVDIISIDIPLPPVIDDAREFLPKEIEADLVLDFLKHPDLSYDLAKLCAKKEIPVIASGKKIREKGVISPPT